MEEYIEGLIAVGIPIKTYSENTQAAIWAVGLNRQLTEERLVQTKNYLWGIEKEMNQRFQ